MEDTVLADDEISFFQRCRRAAIGPISNEDVRAVLEQPVIDATGWIEPAVLDVTVTATRDSPMRACNNGSSRAISKRARITNAGYTRFGGRTKVKTFSGRCFWRLGQRRAERAVEGEEIRGQALRREHRGVCCKRGVRQGKKGMVRKRSTTGFEAIKR